MVRTKPRLIRIGSSPSPTGASRKEKCHRLARQGILAFRFDLLQRDLIG